jgi:hypothetical protein
MRVFVTTALSRFVRLFVAYVSTRAGSLQPVVRGAEVCGHDAVRSTCGKFSL